MKLAIRTAFAAFATLALSASPTVAQSTPPKAKSSSMVETAAAPTVGKATSKAPVAPKVSASAQLEAPKAPVNPAPKTAETKNAAPVAKDAKASPAKASEGKAEAKSAESKPVGAKPAEVAPATGKAPKVSEAKAAEDEQKAAEGTAAMEQGEATPADGTTAPADGTAANGETKPTNADAAAAEKKEPETPPPPAVPLSALMRMHISVDTVWNKDPGYDFLSNDDVGQRIGLLLDFDVLELSDAVTLALELGLAGESEKNTDPPRNLGSHWELGSTHLSGGVIGRVAILDQLDVHLRASGGTSFTDLTLTDAANESTKTEATQPFATLGAGFSVMTNPRRLDSRRKHFNSVAFGARLEGGYVLSNAIALAYEDRAVDIPVQRVRVDGAALGALDRSGAFMEVAGFVRF